MKKSLFSLFLFTFLFSCEKNNDYLINFTIKNSSSKVFNGKIEAITYLNQKQIFLAPFTDLKNGDELVVQLKPQVLVNNEGIYYVTITDEEGVITKKGFGAFDGYDFLGRKYNIVLGDAEILIK
mgnify:FL=1